MVVENDIEKEDLIRRFLEQRIEENRNLFNDEEMRIIESNKRLIKKIYILGGINFNKI